MSKMPEFENVPDDEIIAEIYCHIVFWTRQLQPALRPDMLAGACEVMDQAMFAVAGEALAAGGTENHLHILVRMSPDHSLVEVLDALRKGSAVWGLGDSGNGSFHWSENDVAVSIDPEELGAAREFIERQASHHEIVTFQSELKAIFDEHGFDYDEQELWN